MEIINRDKEREQLFRSNAKYILLSAPTRYGKSHLLQIAESELEDSWEVARVDLRSSKFDSYLPTRQELLKAIWDQIATSEPYPEGTQLGLIIGRLIYTAASIKAPLLFVLDGAEIVSDSKVVWWLRDDIIHPIADKRDAENRATRFIISGQAFSTNWIETNRTQTGQLGFSERMMLGPFNHSHIEEALSDRVKKAKEQERGTWTPPDVSKLALKVIQFSGGHPAAVQHMLTQLEGTFYRPENGEDFYHTAYRRSTRVEWNHTLALLDEILAELHPRAVECFKYLSVFRQCDIEIVKIVWTHTIDADADTLAGDELYDDLFTRLEHNDLVLVDKDTGFSRNDIYRTILERQLRMREQDKWLALHYLALKCFYQQLRLGYSFEKKRNHFPYDASLIKETFYHSSVILAQLDSPNWETHLQDQLLRDLNVLKEHHRPSHYPSSWRDIIKKAVFSPIEADDDIKAVFIEWGKETELTNLIDRVRAQFLAPEA